MGFNLNFLFVSWLHHIACNILVSPHQRSNLALAVRAPRPDEWIGRKLPWRFGFKSFSCPCCRLFVTPQLGTSVCVRVCVYALCVYDWAPLHLCKFSVMKKCVKGMRMDVPQGPYFLKIYLEGQKRRLLCHFSGTRREDLLIPINCIALTMSQLPFLNF